MELGFLGPANGGGEAETENAERDEEEVHDVDGIDECCGEVGVRWALWGRELAAERRLGTMTRMVVMIQCRAKVAAGIFSR